MDIETTDLKPETARLVHQSRVLALDESTRRVKHVISTGALDRSNRMVEPSGWRLSKFRDNPVVLADHEYVIERIIGRAYETKVENGALTSVTQFAEEGLGNVAFRLVQAGIVNAWSVGWTGIKSHRIGELEDCEACAAAMKKSKVDYGTHYLQQELLEYSLVAIPSNPEAVMGLCTAGLVATMEADAWLEAYSRAAPESSDPEPEADPEPDTTPSFERSAAFYDSLFKASRNYARRAALRLATSRRSQS